MAMTIKLYHNDSDKRTVNKTLTNEGSLTGATIIDETTILNPRLKVRDNGIIMVQYNYCYIADFKRYYYITNITVSNGYIIIDCKVDVLMSYAAEIRACTGVIARQENVWSGYLDDSENFTNQYNNVSLKAFTSPFSKTLSYILLVNG